MSPDSDDQTRQFLEQLIDRRRSENLQQNRHSSMHQKLLEQEQLLHHQIELLQQRNSIQNFFMSQHTMNSPIADVPMAGAESLRCEATCFGGSSLETKMDLMHWQRGQSMRVRRGDGSVGSASSFCTSFEGTGTARGVAEHLTNKWHGEDFKFQPSFPFSPSLSPAKAQHSTSSHQSPLLKGHRETHFPRIMKSHFFLPLLPSMKKRSSARKFKTPMKSYKALWRVNTTALVSPEARTEILSRAVCRGRVKIRDHSRTLPPTLPFRMPLSGGRAQV
jgi:hypothetical protein